MSTSPTAANRAEPGDRTAPEGLAAPPTVAAATRVRTPGWRDPRLWIGVLIVAASVVVGVRVVGAADESVSVWGLAGDLGPGDTVTADDLVAMQVRFVDPGEPERYLLTDAELPADLQLTRAVGRGELLPRDALGGSGETDLAEVPLPVTATRIPPSLSSGSLVDVYVSRPADGGGEQEAELVMESVVVVEAPPSGGDLGGDELRQVVVGVPDDQGETLPRALGLTGEGIVSLTRVG